MYKLNFQIIFGENADVDLDGDESTMSPKIQKKNTCVACLGLLQEGIQSDWLDKVLLQIRCAPTVFL